jgi:hypothetical protein
MSTLQLLHTRPLKLDLNSGYAEYFDSYSLQPYKQEVRTYIQRHSISWAFNRDRLQGLKTNVCGHYCCIYALHRAKGMSMTSFVEMFLPARYTCNDIKAVRMFRAQFGVSGDVEFSS